MTPLSLGIDVAQATLACCLLTDRPHHRQVPNTPAGWRTLQRWLTPLADGQAVTVTLEATGGYEEAVATALHAAGYTIYRVNPFRVKRWAESALLRTKTDPVDAWALAEFGRTATKLHPWAPVPPAYRTLQALVRAKAALQATRQQYRNRLKAPGIQPEVKTAYDALIQTVEREIASLTAQIRQLLRSTPLRDAAQVVQSIPGIGEETAAVLLGELGDAQQFSSAKQLVAFAGLSVQEATSGTSVHKRARLAKRGSPFLRQALYFPAVTAFRCHPHLRAVAHRLLAHGKVKLQVIGALMRKLLELVYAVLRTGKPYDPQYRHPRNTLAA